MDTSGLRAGTSVGSVDPADSDPPRVPYWHVWTDDDEVSRQSLSEISDFELAPFAVGGAPQWNRFLMTGDATVAYSVMPPGWFSDWHENPKPQWIIPLAGVWYVETMDGMRVEMGPGEVSFGCDMNTKVDAEGRTGHRAGTVGDAPVTLMVIQLDGDKYVGARPGAFS